MYLNVNLASNASGGGGGNDSSATAAGSCTTPRTPEILNLLAGAPFDNVASYGGGGRYGSATNIGNASGSSSFSYFQSSSSTPLGSAGVSAGLPASTPGDGPSSPGEHASSSFSSFSSLCSSPATPSTPPAGGPPSIQNTRTYLIKEGLKLTIQSKRLASGRGSLESDQHGHMPLKDEMGQLTTEDEERRRRRRERNKVAATKCRNRKKERTGILMQESDALEDQNVNFRSEIQRLEAEKRRLMDVLAMHSPTCLKTAAGNHRPTPTSCSSDFIQHDPGTGTASQVGTRGGESVVSFDHQVVVPSDQAYVMSGGLSSSNYGPMYDCNRSSSESAAMAGNHHHHHSSTYDVTSETSAGNYNNNSGEGPPSYVNSQVNLIQQRGSYGGGDNNLSGQNYR
ncbi:activating transcription factor 3-like isoform X1 [Daphnia pulex]|uniref:activating transcription factor 3-like isoform X1 n=1 Tax=Daphnia pulex TaxID=6669 RepID=UPI001EE00C08|nr:activating transcription factor 3-like isoform X1 [Daphnia pulex]